MNLINIIKNKSINLKDEITSHSSTQLMTFLNPYSYLLARNNTKLFSQFNQIHIDGILLVKTLKLFGITTVERKSFDMTSMAPEVFLKASKKNETVYFVGTEAGVINTAVANIQKMYPELQILGYRNGYFESNLDRENVLKCIGDLKPDIVVIGMGTPLQEKFLIDLQETGWKGEGYTCGGFLHQTANKLQYYPHWIDKYNIRWIYRIYDEPKLFKRYFWEYPKFLMVFLYDYINYKVNNIHTNTTD